MCVYDQIANPIILDGDHDKKSFSERRGEEEGKLGAHLDWKSGRSWQFFKIAAYKFFSS